MQTDWTLIFVRFAHYAFAFLWMAMGFFSAFVIGFTMPSLDPESRNKMMSAMLPRISPLAGIGAALTLITGIWLYKGIYGGDAGIGLAHARGAWVMAAMAGGTLMFLLALAVTMPTSIKIGKAQRGLIQANVPQ